MKDAAAVIREVESLAKLSNDEAIGGVRNQLLETTTYASKWVALADQLQSILPPISQVEPEYLEEFRAKVEQKILGILSSENASTTIEDLSRAMAGGDIYSMSSTVAFNAVALTINAVLEGTNNDANGIGQIRDILSGVLALADTDITAANMVAEFSNLMYQASKWRLLIGAVNQLNDFLSGSDVPLSTLSDLAGDARTFTETHDLLKVDLNLSASVSTEDLDKVGLTKAEVEMCDEDMVSIQEQIWLVAMQLITFGVGIGRGAIS